MRLVEFRHLINRGPFADSVQATEIHEEIIRGISMVKWPVGGPDFTLNPESQGNGVKPIKNDFMRHLEDQGWRVEQKMSLAASLAPGKVDAVLQLADRRHFAAEWETGNISSSHRALNKIALGMLDGCVAGGALILPSRAMYQYLTDRVGNYQEISPYFPLWESIPAQGRLTVYSIEHDQLSGASPLIPKGTDGRALV